MKKKLNSVMTGLLIALLILAPSMAKAQNEKAVAKKYYDPAAGRTKMQYASEIQNDCRIYEPRSLWQIYR